MSQLSHTVAKLRMLFYFKLSNPCLSYIKISKAYSCLLFHYAAHGLGFWTDRSAVHEAAAQGRALQLQQLIEAGAAVNLVAVDSITPLHEACIQGQTQCVRLLLDAGAQVSRRWREMRTVMV